MQEIRLAQMNSEGDATRRKIEDQEQELADLNSRCQDLHCQLIKAQTKNEGLEKKLRHLVGTLC